MTFDELMAEYFPLIENASRQPLAIAAFELKPDEPSHFRTLVLALEKDLAEALEGDNLRKGAIMAAKELISRFTLPSGHGATHEDFGGSYSEVDNLDPEEALVEAPSAEATISQPSDYDQLQAYMKRKS